MWTKENRAQYDRSNLRYPSDVTDAEWLLIVPLIPPGKRGGGKRKVNICEVVNGLMYILSTGGSVANFLFGRAMPGIMNWVTQPAHRTAALDAICPSRATGPYGSCA